MIPLIPIITAFLSSTGKKKVPGFAQNLGGLITSKTNQFTVVIITYAIATLTGEPDWVDRIICNLIIVMGMYSTFSRDTKFKNP